MVQILKNLAHRLKQFLVVLHMIAETCRYLTSLTVGAISYLVLFSLSGSWGQGNIIRIIPMVIVTGVGFIINDIGDYTVDIKAKKNRPIAQGRLNRNIALFAISSLMSIAFLIDILMNNPASTLFTSLVFALLIFYTVTSKRFPITKNLFTAVLCLSPFVYPQMIVGKQIDPVIYLSVLMFIFGRELLIDSSIDYDSDNSQNIRTIAVILRKPANAIYSWAFMFLGLIILVSFPGLNILPYVVSVLLLIVSVLLYVSHKLWSTAMRVTLAAMVISAIACYV